MIYLLSKIFIKNASAIEDTKVRRDYGVLCGGVGIFLNILLFLGKFLAGFFSGSVAIIADAFNNFLDAGSSIITMVGFRISGQHPDKKHPYGHGRMEYISGFIVAMLILITGFELIENSIQKIIHPTLVTYSPWVIVFLLVSIFIKIYMAYYNKVIGNKINSSAMKATSVDCLTDTIATSVVFLCTLISYFSTIHLDGVCGVFVGAFVLYAGYNTAKDTISPLLGQNPSKEFVDKIYHIIDEYEGEGVLGIHDLMVHDYGPGRVMISVHVEVPASGNIIELHDLIDRIEHHLRKELNCEAVIHMDPILTDDEETLKLKEIVKKIIEHMEGNIQFHDFRIVVGPTHTNLIFDVVVPYEYVLKDEEVIEYINKRLHEIDTSYHAVIEVDKDYR